MGLFKNEVGRPSNETLKKRKMAYFAIALGAVALIGGGGYYAYKTFNKGDIGSTSKNIETTAVTYKYGDVNGDGRVNARDASMSGAYLNGNTNITLKNEQIRAADVDQDGLITKNDSTLIFKKANEVIEELPIKMGDVNKDGKVAEDDAKLIQKYLVNSTTFTDEQKVIADVDMSGEVDVTDVTQIQRYIAGTVKSLPVIPSGEVTKKVPEAIEPDIVLTAYKYENNKKVGAALKTVTNADLSFDKWSNYQYMLDIHATSKNAKIKSIKWEINTSGKETTKEADTAAAWKKGDSKTWTYDSNDVTKSVGIYADGVRLGKITVTDTDGKVRVLNVKFYVGRDIAKPKVTLTAYKSKDDKKIGGSLKTTTNKDLVFSDWANHEYTLAIKAHGVQTTIKSIKWEINAAGKQTTAAATTADAWKKGGVSNWSYKTQDVSKEVGIYADGVRAAKITVTDAEGRVRVLNAKFYIDKTAPTIKYSISGSKSGSSYYTGANVTATCSDGISKVKYMYTYDTQDSSDSRKFANQSSVGSKSQTISLVSTGSGRNITSECRDVAGNISKSKSSSYSIISYPSYSGGGSSSSGGGSSSSSKSSGSNCYWKNSTVTRYVSKNGSCHAHDGHSGNTVTQCNGREHVSGNRKTCTCTYKVYTCK